jgi:NDP-sugar pyrophosphorylase family protein
MAKAAAGIILAAGLGTRLKALTDKRPKPLMEVAGEPLIEYLINKLIAAGVTDIYINLFYKSQYIINYLKTRKFEAAINFSLEEQILGTGGGVRRIVEKYNIKQRELIILNGDIWCDFPIKLLLNTTNFATLLCAENREIDGYVGTISADASNLIIELGRYYRSSDKFAQKRGFFTGVHVLSSEAIDMLIINTSNCLVSEIYASWLRDNYIIKAHIAKFDYEDLGSPQRLLDKNLDFLKQRRQNFIIHPTAIIEDPASLGPEVIIGARARIKKGAQLTKTIVMSDTIIEKDERLDCAIALLDARVFLG